MTRINHSNPAKSKQIQKDFTYTCFNYLHLFSKCPFDPESTSLIAAVLRQFNLGPNPQASGEADDKKSSERFWAFIFHRRDAKARGREDFLAC
jgi:hypothetical protein